MFDWVQVLHCLVFFGGSDRTIEYLYGFSLECTPVLSGIHHIDHNVHCSLAIVV
jgi:hypothetical protein